MGEPVATYVFSGPLEYAVRDFTVGSKYLLYDGGVFVLRYDSSSEGYPGTYRQDNVTITFEFEDSGNAMGTVQGELLEVRYSEMMQHSDFENAVYRRSQ